jgi:hypothetical protein
MSEKNTKKRGGIDFFKIFRFHHSNLIFYLQKLTL